MTSLWGILLLFLHFGPILTYRVTFLAAWTTKVYWAEPPRLWWLWTWSIPCPQLTRCFPKSSRTWCTPIPPFHPPQRPEPQFLDHQIRYWFFKIFFGKMAFRFWESDFSINERFYWHKVDSETDFFEETRSWNIQLERLWDNFPWISITVL